MSVKRNSIFTDPLSCIFLPFKQFHVHDNGIFKCGLPRMIIGITNDYNAIDKHSQGNWKPIDWKIREIKPLFTTLLPTM